MAAAVAVVAMEELAVQHLTELQIFGRGFEAEESLPHLDT